MINTEMFIRFGFNESFMPVLNLMAQNESKIKSELEQSIRFVRNQGYDIQRDCGSFFREFTKGLYRHFSEGNKPLINGLKDVIAIQGKITSIADFCCGSGKSTLRIANTFPNAEIYGFDVLPYLIVKAKKRARENPRIHFKKADVYHFENGYKFDVVSFHHACGTLADKVMEYGTKHETPIIVGRFCCYHTIPNEMPISKNAAQNVYLKLTEKLYDFVQDRVAKNYVSPRDDVDCDLLSKFVMNELGSTITELKKIATLSVDSKLGSKIVDLNRVMKLIERKYDVAYDELNRLVVARRK